jgi:hypothetical protein
MWQTPPHPYLHEQGVLQVHPHNCACASPIPPWSNSPAVRRARTQHRLTHTFMEQSHSGGLAAVAQPPPLCLDGAIATYILHRAEWKMQNRCASMGGSYEEPGRHDFLRAFGNRGSKRRTVLGNAGKPRHVWGCADNAVCRSCVVWEAPTCVGLRCLATSIAWLVVVIGDVCIRLRMPSA